MNSGDININKQDAILAALHTAANAAAAAAVTANTAVTLVQDRLSKIETSVSLIPVLDERLKNLCEDTKDLKADQTKLSSRIDDVEKKIDTGNGFLKAERQYRPLLFKAGIVIFLLAAGYGGGAGIVAIIKLLM